ncbi:MAG TPA: hypothetical protein VMN78_13905 [Longimicrobiales bacterium]|nr:hypothetical protein [Longimicrobiales bacterium]
MKKVLLLLLLILLFLTVPPLRSFAAPVIDPVGEKLAILVSPVVDLVRTPFFEWKARDEARAIIKLMRDQEAIGQRLPTARDFDDFLRSRYRANREGLDPWGVPYYVKYTGQRAVVGSAGADMEVGTADDVTEVLPLRLR